MSGPLGNPAWAAGLVTDPGPEPPPAVQLDAAGCAELPGEPAGVSADRAGAVTEALRGVALAQAGDLARAAGCFRTAVRYAEAALAGLAGG